MYEHDARSIHHNLYSIFHDGILVMCPNSTEPNSLIVILQGILEHFGSKDTTISMVVLDSDIVLLSKLLKQTLGMEGFHRHQRRLILYPDEARCMVDKNGASHVHNLFGCPTS